MACTVCHADEEDAIKFFHEATSRYDRGEFVAATRLFREAYALSPNWKILCNIDQCEAAIKHYDRAMESFEKFLSEAGDDITDERRSEIEKELDRLKRLVRFVDLTAPDTAQIYVDEEFRGNAPLSGKLMIAAAVEHKLQVLLDGNVLLEKTVQVSGVENISLTANKPLTQNATKETDAQMGRHAAMKPLDSRVSLSPLQKTSMVLFGAAGATLFLALITGSIALSKDKDLEGPCADGGCPPAYHDDNDQKDHLAVAANVLYVVGASVAVVGGILFTVSKTKNIFV